MSPLVMLLSAWGVLTAILIILLIYRSTLTMQEDDQLFLDEAESHMEQEQAEILSKVNKITPFIRTLGAVSGAMILVIAGMAVYQGLNNTAPLITTRPESSSSKKRSSGQSVRKSECLSDTGRHSSFMVQSGSVLRPIQGAS